jgi:hypothetical protein
MNGTSTPEAYAVALRPLCNGILFSEEVLAPVLECFVRDGQYLWNEKLLNEWKKAQERHKKRILNVLSTNAKRDARRGAKRDASVPSRPVPLPLAVPSEQESPKKDSCPEPSPKRRSSGPIPTVPPDEVLIRLPMNTTNTDGVEYPISQAVAAEFSALYPKVDVPQTLREMRAWCLANHTKRKTASGMMKFVNGWLNREQCK